jgi:predicted RecA/RadA family phage recombinase
MRNYKSSGTRLTLTAPYDVASGAGFLVGTIFAIALFAALSGQKVEGERNGLVTLPKAAGAVTQGQKLYWDDAAKLVTTTAAGNKLIGAAAVAAANGDATVDVVLIPTA